MPLITNTKTDLARVLYHNQDLVKLSERNAFIRAIYEKIQAINSTDDLGEIKHIASTK